MKKPNNFIPYGRQWIDSDDIKAVIDVLKSDYLTQGPKIEEFENALCKYTGAKYAVAVSSGTAALHLAVLSLGIERGDEGITSPITFVSSANCLIYAGLKPKFADIDERTYCIDSDEIKRKITKKTKVIIPVHFAGQVADMKAIQRVANKNNLFIIEDASHAVGSKYADKSRVGNCRYSDMTVFSFHPVKTITTGEGGAITTNNKRLYQKLILLRTHGITKDPKKLSENPGPWYYEMQELGFNYRMNDMQATLGISQFRKLGKFIKRRKEIVGQYNQSFKNVSGITIPFEKYKGFSAFHLYVLQIDFRKIGKTRAQVMNDLRIKGIGTQVHYIPVHLQPYYQKSFGYKKGDFPVADKYYDKALSIPLYPKMSNKDVEYVISQIKNALKRT